MAEYQYGGRNTETFHNLPGFKKVVAWQAASDLFFFVNQLVKRFGPDYFKLAAQLRSAAIAVSGNIAEGYCSGSLPDYIRYCNIARGLLGGLGSYIQDCERAGLIIGDELATLVIQYSDTSLFLDRLIQTLIKKNQDGTLDNSSWVKEDQATYQIDLEDDTEFSQGPQVP
jgi:four helix bundle protein